MRMRMIAVSICLVAAPRADARPPSEYERFCMEAMCQIESSLTSHLPSDCEIVGTHPSLLGQTFAKATYIRDGWISRNGQVVVKVVLFTWPLPNDPLLSGATVSQVILETETDGGKVTLGIAILGKDEQLVGTVVDIINRSLRSQHRADLQKTVQVNGGGGTAWLLLITGTIVAGGIITTVLVWRAKR
jgi:hypothetical protein